VSERVYLRDFDLQQLDEQKLKELPGGAKKGAAGEVAVGYTRGSGVTEGEFADPFPSTEP
jgi:hypothetical protein